MPLMPRPSMRFAVGDEVRSIVDSARIGIVKNLGPLHGGVQYYEVFWGGVHGTKRVPATDIVKNLAIGKPTDALMGGVIVGYAEFQRLITFHRLSRELPLRNNIYAFNASRTQFFPFQFKPLIKLLDSSNGRLLICDEVGLGKTIEAGLILLEERARREVRTALVVCPSGLRTKWRMELKRRFDENFRVLDAAAFRGFLDDYEREPDRAELAGIVSLESLRNVETLSRLQAVAPPLDFVIVDEAHHLRNFSTRSRDAGVAITQDAGTVLLMTATPVHLGTENLYSLLNILDPKEFPDEATAKERFRQNEPIVAAQRLLTGGPGAAARALVEIERAAGSSWVRDHPLLPPVLEGLRVLSAAQDPASSRRVTVHVQRDLAELNLLGHLFTRTRKRDVKIEVPVRQARALTVVMNPTEQEFYDAASRLLSEERRRSAKAPIVVQWALNQLQRRMASSVQATVEYYRRTRPFDSDDRAEDEEPSEFVVGEETESLEALRTRVQELVDRWPSGSVDSKYMRLVTMLREQRATRPAAKILVFAFFKETLRYLSSRLSHDGVEHVLIDGGVPPAERERRIAEFRDKESCEVMLSSRVGSEGLDFQFSDTLVNYDLPWNPMDVEQRIGRLDRIGQMAKKIQIVNLWTEGTIEARILSRLYERIGIFERSIGSLDAVIGDIIKEVEGALWDPGLTLEQQEQEMDRIARVIETERQQVEHLEEEVSTFVGVDAFFEEEIEGIRRGRRYVTGEQLLRFLEDYCRHKAPGTRLRYDQGSRRGYLIPDSVLRQVIKQHRRVGDLIRLMGAGPEGLPFTVHSEVANDNPGIEFINVLHPLIEIIREDYESTLRSRVSAQRVALRTKRLRPGHYIVVVYRLRVEGAKAANYLEAVVLDSGLNECLDREESEALLGEMVEKGEEPFDGTIDLDPEFGAAAVRKAEEFFGERLTAVRAELMQANAALIDRKITSLRFQKERQLARKRAVLERQMAEGKPEQILRLARGQITKAEGELERQSKELESRRQVEVGYDEVAATILEVLAPTG